MNYTDYTAQSIFDTVLAHLRKQGKAAIVYDATRSISSCSYRGDNGTSCAVGCLIKDEDYIPQFEGKNVRGLLTEHGSLAAISWMNPYISLLTALQHGHDNVLKAYGLDAWEKYMEDLAPHYKLTYTEQDEQEQS